MDEIDIFFELHVPKNVGVSRKLRQKFRDEIEKRRSKSMLDSKIGVKRETMEDIFIELLRESSEKEAVKGQKDKSELR